MSLIKSSTRGTPLIESIKRLVEGTTRGGRQHQSVGENRLISRAELKLYLNKLIADVALPEHHYRC